MKTFVMMAAFLVALTLCACGGNNSSPSTPQAAPPPAPVAPSQPTAACPNGIAGTYTDSNYNTFTINASCQMTLNECQEQMTFQSTDATDGTINVTSTGNPSSCSCPTVGQGSCSYQLNDSVLTISCIGYGTYQLWHN